MSCFQGGRGRGAQVGRGNVRVIRPGPFEIACPLTQALSWNVDINTPTGKAQKEWAKTAHCGRRQYHSHLDMEFRKVDHR